MKLKMSFMVMTKMEVVKVMDFSSSIIFFIVMGLIKVSKETLHRKHSAFNSVSTIMTKMKKSWRIEDLWLQEGERKQRRKEEI